ncbi:MAG TPA: redoxin family protein [Pirellulaceae bacterium]|nr:redoxin family protein [Pirellulaceae bacterium]
MAALLVAPAASFAQDVVQPKIGETIAKLRFKDIRYLPRSLEDFGEKKAFVLVFTNTTCPLVQRYWPKLKRLDEQYRDQGVQFVSVNVGADDEIQEIAQQAIDFGIEFPLVKDVDGSCVKALGALRTPEVAVLDDKFRLVYRGRIDDQVRLVGSRPDVQNDDLANAIEAVLAGRAPKAAETPVDGCLITLPSPREVSTPVTFHEHIAPLFQKHCQECHHTGGGAPFSLVTLEEVSSQAQMIREVVLDRRMPPWYAHRRQSFVNERGLSAKERTQIADWVQVKMPAGDPAKTPPPRTFADSKWEIGEPDLTITALEAHELPADGFVDYRYAILPHVFLHDTWISAAEILPSNPAVVHHCNMAFVTLGQSFSDGNFITGRVPGGTAMTLNDGVALRIPAGSVVGLQIHYTTTGKPEKNRMSIGFRYPREVVHKELHHLQVSTSRFEIPPGAAAHKVSATRTLPCDALGVGMFSHMHLRGKDMTFIAHSPTGEDETLLSIPNYHYGWQQNYRWQPGTRRFAKGTKIEVIAHYDNSAFNPFNPDPTAAVKHGPQTVEEMMYGFFFYTDASEDLKLNVDPKTGRVVKSEADQPAKAQDQGP